MLRYKKASEILKKDLIGNLFSLKFHYKNYKFKAETNYCLLIDITNKTASFLHKNRIGVYDLYDKDIVLYAKQT
jgi:hypothetical protein